MEEAMRRTWVVEQFWTIVLLLGAGCFVAAVLWLAGL
jgi:hypothetical protein